MLAKINFGKKDIKKITSVPIKILVKGKNVKIVAAVRLKSIYEEKMKKMNKK